MTLSIFKFTGIAEAVWQFQFSDAVHDAVSYLARIRATICKEDLRVALGFIIDKLSFEDCTIPKLQLTKALSYIHRPVAFVENFAHVSPSILDFSITMLFSLDKVSNVLSTIVISPSSLTHDLTILKHASILASISH